MTYFLAAYVLLIWGVGRTPQSAHHPHQNHDEHRQCNPGGGIHFAVLLGSDNSYTTPFEIPFLIRSPLWWRYMVGGPLGGGCRNCFQDQSEGMRVAALNFPS